MLDKKSVMRKKLRRNEESVRLVIQRVTEASVTIEGVCRGKINRGFLVLLGVGAEDTKETADKYADKLLKLRIFEDENGKTNLSLKQVEGELLVISQFTLYADCSHGNRPSFINAGEPVKAEELYEYFLYKCRESGLKTECGEFGADMSVSLVNDGPFTIIMDESTVKI